MKKITVHSLVFFGIVFAVIFLGYFYYKSKGGEKSNKVNKSTSQEKIFPIIENKSIVVIVTSYNVEPWCERSLKSVFDQNYLDFRIIYIDDNSSDRTYEKIKDFVEVNHLQNQITLMRNNKRVGAAANYYKAIHTCEDHEIIVCLDGDDWLAHEDVLSSINATYADPDVWLSYSDFLNYPSYQRGVSGELNKEEILKKGYRGHKWVCSQLKTFYAGLFKKIKLQEFFYEGHFLLFRWDWPIMFAMMEMAHGHIKYIREILVIHNVNNPLNNDKLDITKQIKIGAFSRSLQPYKPLIGPPYLAPKNNKLTDVIIFSLDRCLQLHACLESMQKYMTGVNNVYVIYFCSNEKYKKGYEILKTLFPSVNFILQSSLCDQTFKDIVMKHLLDEKQTKSQYVIFGVDSSLLKDYVDLHLVEKMMEKTNAYAFFLCLGNIDLQKNLPPLFEITNDILTWQFHYGEDVWNWPHNLDMTVYRKKDIKDILVNLEFHNPNDLRKYWGIRRTPSSQDMALCFKESKVLHMSGYQQQIFITPEEFQEKYLEGYKINILPLHQIKNDFYHVDHEVEFIKR